MRYKGITYPKVLDNQLVRWLWRRYMCPRGCHLLDEVDSMDEWYLSCDACGLEVHIDWTNKEYVK